MNRRAIFAGSVAAAGLAAGVGAALRPARAASRTSDRIPDIEVFAHDGSRARFYTDLVKGKAVIINAMFAGCGEVCPMVTANVVRIQELLGARVGRDIFIYSFTLLPELETPEILADYAREHGVGPGWLFLTGAKIDMNALRVGLGFYSSDPDLDVLNDTHTGTLRYGNERLDRWSGCPALQRPESTVKEIRETIAIG